MRVRVRRGISYVLGKCRLTNICRLARKPNHYLEFSLEKCFHCSKRKTAKHILEYNLYMLVNSFMLVKFVLFSNK